jgi:protocatechuate 3,4-dioxygenase alpha subunit
VVSHDRLTPTASQTAGPFLSIGLRPLERTGVVAAGTPGAVLFRGRVLDGAGAGVPDAAVELWQADAEGRFDTSPSEDGTAPGFGRSLTDAEGRFRFVTVKPGPLAGPFGPEAPRLELLVFARGLLRPVRTRAYFPDEVGPNGSDPVLSRVPAERRETLVARTEGDELVFDIRLQGPGETVFFAC